MNLSKHLRLLFLVLAAALGAVDSWSWRYYLNPMGISYLDMGDAFMHRDWSTALNGLWSPLYSLPLGLAMRFFKPSPQWEIPLVHLVGFFTYLVSLIAFDFFLRELIRRQHQFRDLAREQATVLPGWTMVALGYAVFLWCSLGLIKMSTTAPDILFSVFVYLALAMLLRIQGGVGNWLSFFLLGLILGFGYLTKNPMLPLSPVFILVALFFTGSPRRAVPRAAVALLGLVLVAGPFIVALSAAKHRLTTGDSARLNYLWHVNRLPSFHWQGGNPSYGNPEHPTRKVFEHPAVYEFGSPLNATYPPWYDPSYWYEGAVPRFNLSQQIHPLIASAQVYWNIFWDRSHLVLAGGFLLLLYVGRRNWLRNLFLEWSILLISFVAFALYLPVHVEPRYVAPFIAPVWLGLFSSLRLPPGEGTKKLVKYLAVAMVTLVIPFQGARSILTFRSAVTDPARHQTELLQLEVAEELSKRGLRPGDAVGMINFNPFWLPIVDWARLSRLRIVAELPNTESDVFATADDLTRQEVIQTFARAGAQALIAVQAPGNVTLSGWERLGQTDYYVLKLSSP